MKQTIFHLLLALAAVSCRGQFIAHVTIYNEDNKQMTVYLDGEKKNTLPASRVRIINLREPYYKLKLVFEDTLIEPIIKTRFEVQDGRGYPSDRTFIVKKNRKGVYTIHWKSETAWPGYIKPETTQEQPQAKQEKASCAEPSLNDSSFAQAHTGFAAIQSEETRWLALKQFLSTNCVGVQQVNELLRLFSAEDKKLELAKLAYVSTVDKGNYFKLNTAFEDEKSVEALYLFINSK